MTEIRTFCRYCSASCGVVVDVHDGRVLQIPGDDDHPMSRGYLCPKGRMLGLTARFAAEWNAMFVDAALFRQRNELLAVACEREGRDPSTIGRSVCPLIFLTDDDATRDELRQRSRPDAPALIGGVNELIDQLNALAQAGVDEFGVFHMKLGTSPEERFDKLELLRTEVIPAVG